VYLGEKTTVQPFLLTNINLNSEHSDNVIQLIKYAQNCACMYTVHMELLDIDNKFLQQPLVETEYIRVQKHTVLCYRY
jgi:hypothetical protein